MYKKYKKVFLISVVILLIGIIISAILTSFYKNKVKNNYRYDGMFNSEISYERATTEDIKIIPLPFVSWYSIKQHNDNGLSCATVRHAEGFVFFGKVIQTTSLKNAEWVRSYNFCL